DGPGGDLRPLDRWMVSRARALVADCTDAFEERLSHRLVEAFEAYLDDLSNLYIRRSRPRVWDGDETAPRVLGSAVLQAVRVVAPVMPFLADHLGRNLVAEACEGAPASVHLSGWPQAADVDEGLLVEVAEVRRVVELGRAARSQANVKLRQPLGRLLFAGAPAAAAHADEIADELRVKDVQEGFPEARYRM